MSGSAKPTAALAPQELHRRAEKKAMEEARKAAEASRRAEDHQRELREVFMSREVQPTGMAR